MSEGSLDFDTYNKRSSETADYSSLKGSLWLEKIIDGEKAQGICGMYPFLGLTGESGEVADKVKKAMRDDNWVITEERRVDLLKELGDVLWYIAACARELDSNIEEVAKMNIEKLKSRSDRGVLGGSGDNR